MSDPVGPEIRVKAVKCLREVVNVRNLPKSPEEFEQLLFEKSKGNKKTYLHMLSKVRQSGVGSNASSASTQRPQQSGVPTAANSLVPQQQLQPTQQVIQRASGPFQLVRTPVSSVTAVAPAGPSVPSNRPRLQAVLTQPIVLPQSHSQLQPVYQKQSHMQTTLLSSSSQPQNRAIPVVSMSIIPNSSQVSYVPIQPMNKVPANNQQQQILVGSSQQHQQTLQISPVQPSTAHTLQSGNSNTVQSVNPSDNIAHETNTASSAKPASDAQTPEAQAKIVAELTKMASLYLPALKHAINVVSKQPDTAEHVRKYVKLRDMLENPEAPVRITRLSQLKLIESLLMNIERNPYHLMHARTEQQKQQQQQQGPRQPSQQQPVQQGKTIVDKTLEAGNSGAGNVPSKHLKSEFQPGQSQADGNAVDQSRQRAMIQQQHSPQTGRLRANLSTLLNQPGGLPSPTGTIDGSQGSSFAVSLGRFSSCQPFTSSSPDLQNLSATSQSSDYQRHLTLTHGLADSFMGRTIFQSGQSARQSGFYGSTFQMMSTEFQKMKERCQTDQAYSKRLSRAIEDISRETKELRDTLGIRLAQDIQLHGTITSNSSRSKVNRLLESSKQRAPFSDGNISSPPSPKIKTDTAPEATHLSSSNVQDVPMTEIESARIGDIKIDGLVDGTKVHESNTSGAIHTGIQNHNFDELFPTSALATALDPVSSLDPLQVFPSDQLNRVNYKVRREVEQLRMIAVCATANTTPPDMCEMETFATCMDTDEWNASCHLVLSCIDEHADFLPCLPPILMVRLAPDYLKSGQLNWYYVSKESRLSDTSRSSCSQSTKTRYSPKECAEFLDLCYTELDRSLGNKPRQYSTRHQSLYGVGKTWMDCICAAVARFVNFDDNLIIAAQGY